MVSGFAGLRLGLGQLRLGSESGSCFVLSCGVLFCRVRFFVLSRPSSCLVRLSALPCLASYGLVLSGIIWGRGGGVWVLLAGSEPLQGRKVRVTNCLRMMRVEVGVGVGVGVTARTRVRVRVRVGC
jgi:hypothetical protein